MCLNVEFKFLFMSLNPQISRNITDDLIVLNGRYGHDAAINGALTKMKIDMLVTCCLEEMNTFLNLKHDGKCLAVM